MKLIVILGLLSFGSMSLAIEQSDKNINMFNEISKKFETPIHFDPLNYPSSLVSGRCYTKNSRLAKGGALVVNTILQDDGPMGGGSNVVSLGNVVMNPLANFYDSMTFQDYVSTWDAKFFEFEQLLNNDYILGSGDEYVYRFAGDLNGTYVYAIKTLGNDDYPYSPIEACYFFKDNQ